MVESNNSNEEKNKLTTRNVFRVLLNSSLSATKVGATQIAYVLLGYKFVIRSRDVIPVNALIRKDVACRVKNMKALEKTIMKDGDKASALETHSTSSNLGRRDAYSAFVKQQNGLNSGQSCQLTYFDLLTHYEITRAGKSRKRRNKDEAIDDECDDDTDDDDERIHVEQECIFPCVEKDSPPQLLQKVGHHGLSSDAPEKFRIGDLYFTRVKRDGIVCPRVLSLCPYMTYDIEDETSAYALLLMHRVWPGGLEENILPPEYSAVQYLRHLVDSGQFEGLSDIVTPNRRIRDDLAKGGYEEFRHIRARRDDDTDSEDENVGKDEDYFDCKNDEDVAFDDFKQNADADAPRDDVFNESIQSGESFIKLTRKEYLMGKNNLNKIVQTVESEYSISNSLSSGESSSRNTSEGRGFYPYKDVAKLIEELNELRKRLKTVDLQHKSFAYIEKHLRDKIGEKLKMIITGPGGTGKTELIHAIVRLAKILFGRTAGKYGPVIVLAPSGAAAANAGT